MAELTFNFPADHPCAAGHFPGNPIIPGALLLAEVLARIARDRDAENHAWRVSSAKFPQPVRPGDAVHISYELTPGNEIRFECRVLNHKVLSGIARQPGNDGGRA